MAGKTSDMKEEQHTEDDQSDIVNSCIDKLVCETRTSYWRTALLDLLKPHFQPENIKKILQFLLSNTFSAMRVCEKGSDTPVDIDTLSVPPNFDLVNWRRILIGISLSLCEPDTNRDINMIGVSISSKTKLEYLKGFYFIIQGFMELSWDVLQLVICLQEKDASLLYETLNDTMKGYDIPDFSRKYITETYQQKMQVMRQLGFYRISENNPVTWTKPRHSKELQPLLYVLHGMYRIPVGISASD